MSIKTPIFTIAKDLNVDSNRVILACKKLGINAKGATKRLNKEELEKIKSYFDTGKNVSDEIVNLNKTKEKAKISARKNVSDEIININKNSIKAKSSSRKIEEKVKIKYFKNRLIRKS